MSDEMKVDDGGGRQRTVRVNYPSNANKTKDEPQKPIIEKITVGSVKQRRQPISRRIGSALVAESAENVIAYITMEVLVPAAKDMIIDAFSQGIQRIFYGDSRSRRPDSRTVHTSYNKVSKPSGYESRRGMSHQSRANHDFNDILLESRAEAEEVLDRLRDLIREYNEAKVADLYDLVGITGSFTDDRWGWTDLRSARVRPIQGGYLLELPRTEPLDL